MNLTELTAAIDAKTAKIGIVGLGYVGLPLVRAFVETGYTTIGFDVDAAKIEQLHQGQSYIQHISGDWVSQQIAAGKFDATDQTWNQVGNIVDGNGNSPNCAWDKEHGGC